jgi:hypothetical protein
VLLAEANSQHASPEGRKGLVWAVGTAQAYATQWAPAAIRLQQAHRRSVGTGVRVAVLDTGRGPGAPAAGRPAAAGL